MASTLAQLEGIGAQIDERVRKLVSSPFCPGPLSIAVGLQGDNVPQWLKGREEIAFRIPDAKFLLELLDSVGPLLVTSANRSGCGTEETSEKALEQLSGSPDFVVHGRQCGSVPSTLVNCRYSPPLIERLGAVSREQLSEYLE
jgi:L-threonylcarbamoyladenylate synthase